jgi:hypothetical protein
MRQQKGIHDDNQHDVQLNRGDHEEGYGREERDDHKEGGNDHQEDLDQKEERYRRRFVCFSISITVSYSVTARFAAPDRRAQHFGEDAPDRWSPSLSCAGLVPRWG